MHREGGPRGGAEHLARIHGTEEDKVNCPFYFKIGACRHGDRCSRQHHRPPFSQTVLISHMWQNPMCAVANAGGDLRTIDEKKFQDDFDEFYDEIFEECRKFGEIEDIEVCENLGDHMVGNVYLKFADEEFAEAAMTALNGRFFAGRTLKCEYSPVTDFREARCRQHDESTCARGPYCNFMHIREPSRDLRKHLEQVRSFMIIFYISLFYLWTLFLTVTGIWLQGRPTEGCSWHEYHENGRWRFRRKT
jgi:splicing factor U2AF subunit